MEVMTSSRVSGSGSSTAASAEEAKAVQRSFALGWHVAQLFYQEVPLSTGAALEAPPVLLPMRANLPTDQRYAMVLDTVNHDAVALGTPSASTAPIMDEVQQSNHTAPSVRAKVAKLHTALLAELTASDFRFGKAYSLGSALAETVLRPAEAYREGPDLSQSRPADSRSPKLVVFTDALDAMLTSDRVKQMTRWLADLKSVLPAHAAYATSRTLDLWSGTDSQVRRQNCGKQTLSALVAQGRVWRAMLSGEKQPTDLLKEKDYIDAADELSKRFRTVGRRIVKRHVGALIVLTTLAVAIICAALVSGLNGGAKFAATIATVAATLGVTAKSVRSEIGRLAAKLEAPLWESEVDESVALAAARLPWGSNGVKRSTGETVGELKPTH